MNSFYKFFIEVNRSNLNDFSEFLSYHRYVKDFRKLGTGFLVCFVSVDQQYYDAFVEGVKESFGINQFRELCCAKCNDGSDCLNIAKHNSYCSKHKLS